MQATPQDITDDIRKKQAEWLSDFYKKVAEGGIPQTKDYSSMTAEYVWTSDVDGPDFISDPEAWRVVFPPMRVWISDDGCVAHSIEEVNTYSRVRQNAKFKEFVEVLKA